jgi:hypothetical protein
VEQRIYLAPGVAAYRYSCIRCIRDSAVDGKIDFADVDRAWVHGLLAADVDEASARCASGHVASLVRVAPGVARFPADPAAEPPFRLATPGGDLFALTVLRYEYPAGSDSANWLDVQIEASVGGRAWRASDPALETWNLPFLADWFDGIAAGEPVDSQESFAEPNLVFELVRAAEDGATVQVWIEGELRPTWAKYTSWDERDLGIAFELSAEELRTAARALRAESLRFPPRPEP